jgi:hypothetical protein
MAIGCTMAWACIKSLSMQAATIDHTSNMVYACGILYAMRYCLFLVFSFNYHFDLMHVMALHGS